MRVPARQANSLHAPRTEEQPQQACSISGERGAPAKYSADRVLNYHGQQINYSECAAMPIFYPMLLPDGTANEYGQQLYKYLDKAKSLGADGM